VAAIVRPSNEQPNATGGALAAGAFSADLEWLSQFCNQLNSSTCSLQAALDALKETGPIRTGHKDLDSACGAFHDRWDDGLDMMNDAIATMSEKIKASVEAYRATESALASAYGTGATAPSGTPQAAGPGSSNITSVLG
jgi:hypothetical protein